MIQHRLRDRSRRQLALLSLLSLGALVSPIPHARADQSCAARYLVADGTVTDENTQLVWEQSPPSAGGGFHSWADASAHCSSLALAGGGFRLPTVLELSTIVDDGASLPAIDTTVFLDAGAGKPPDATDAMFWSGTTFAADGTGDKRWYLNFGLGNTAADPVTSLHRVRCVRDGP